MRCEMDNEEVKSINLKLNYIKDLLRDGSFGKHYLEVNLVDPQDDFQYASIKLTAEKYIDANSRDKRIDVWIHDVDYKIRPLKFINKI